MEHYWRFVESGNPLLRGPSWLFNAFVGVLALLFVVFLVYSLVRKSREPERSKAEREIYGNLDGQVRSMLLLAGGVLTQGRISDNLDIPVADVGRELAVMEKRGEIRREWLPLEYDYRVYLAGPAVDQPETRASELSVDPKGPD